MHKYVQQINNFDIHIELLPTVSSHMKALSQRLTQRQTTPGLSNCASSFPADQPEPRWSLPIRRRPVRQITILSTWLIFGSRQNSIRWNSKRQALSQGSRTFQSKILDMDAEIKQTLSYFSVLSFNSNDCLTAATCEILGETLIISSKTTGCDYSNTLFADAATLNDTVLNQSVYAELSAFNKTLRLTSGLFMKNQADPTNPVVTFDCNKHLEESNVLLCREILQDIRFTPLLDFSIIFYYQMKSPRTSLMQLYSSNEPKAGTTIGCSSLLKIINGHPQR
uniref:Uncharacterized protein n=1 Tax=Spironucleus salmonicida TaxID=348837 RepID=V6M672_9EUKA|eukprot:EST48889.1 Hypothetical protein SS50377_11002 [Spironucleus salmonicida]